MITNTWKTHAAIGPQLEAWISESQQNAYAHLSASIPDSMFSPAKRRRITQSTDEPQVKSEVKSEVKTEPPPEGDLPLISISEVPSTLNHSAAVASTPNLSVGITPVSHVYSMNASETEMVANTKGAQLVGCCWNCHGCKSV